MQIRQDGLEHPAVLTLLQTHVDRARAETARGSAHALDLERLRAPDLTFWSAWDGEQLLGIGALRRLSDADGEIKSMHTVEARRGRGIGSALLRHIVAHARRVGMVLGCGPCRPSRSSPRSRCSAR
jgi:putative acetyltransferase